LILCLSVEIFNVKNLEDLNETIYIKELYFILKRIKFIHT